MQITFRKIKSELSKEFHFLTNKKPGNNILFDHLPRCGGRSFKAFLQSNYLWRETYSISGAEPRKYVDRFMEMTAARRSRYRLIQGHLANKLIPYVDENFIKITVFREPVARMISHYFFAKGLPAHYLHNKIHKSNLSLKDYVTSQLTDETENWYTQHFSGLSLTELNKDPEAALKLAEENLQKTYHFVGLTEKLDSFIGKICHETGLVHPDAKLHLNQSDQSGAAKQIDPDILKSIAEKNHLDVKLYNYACNLASEET